MVTYLSRLMLILVGLVAAMLVLVIAIAFLCGAMYLALRDVATQPIAALLSGLAALAISALIVLSAHLVAGGPGSFPKRGLHRDGRPASDDEHRLAAEAASVVGEEIASIMRLHARGTVLASLLAGFAVGASPRLRRVLRELLK